MSSHVDFADATGAEGVNPNHQHASRLRILDAEAGLIERTRDKLAIVGFATSTRDMAPFDDPAYDIGGLNQLYRFIPRADVWMDIHINWDEENVEGTDHRGWIRECGIPVLMTRHHADLPTSVSYPVDAVIQMGTDYLTSSVAFYVAWGIHQGYREIALFGIDLVVGTEYENQKACAEFWLGVAHGKGVDLRIPPQSALLRHTHRYGYQKEPSWGPCSLEEIGRRVASLMKERDALIAKLHALDGAIHEVARHADWQADPEARMKWLTERHEETRAQISTLDGAAQESDYWRNLYLLRSRSAQIRTAF